MVTSQLGHAKSFLAQCTNVQLSCCMLLQHPCVSIRLKALDGVFVLARLVLFAAKYKNRDSHLVVMGLGLGQSIAWGSHSV